MRYYSQTHLGLVRENNEDALLADPSGLFAVADGVGGYNAGEIASRMSLTLLKEWLYRYLEQESNPAYALRRAISMVNGNLYRMSLSKPEYAGMGTTLTAVYLENQDCAHILQVGDSRVYLWHNARLRQLTRDQTVVNELIASGHITEQQGRRHPRKNWLTQAVGTETVVQAELRRIQLEAGDKLLLCTDGLSNMVTGEELVQGMGMATPRDCGEYLLQKALQHGGLDNISLIVADDFAGEVDDGRNN